MFMKRAFNKALPQADKNADELISLEEWVHIIKGTDPKHENPWFMEYLTFMFKLFDVSGAFEAFCTLLFSFAQHKPCPNSVIVTCPSFARRQSGRHCRVRLRYASVWLHVRGGSAGVQEVRLCALLLLAITCRH